GGSIFTPFPTRRSSDLVPGVGLVHVPPAAASPGRVPPAGGIPRPGLYAATYGGAPARVAERRKPPGGGFPLQAVARGFRSAVHSALARLETRVRLADHEDLAATTNDLAVAVTGLRRLQGGQDLHDRPRKRWWIGKPAILAGRARAAQAAG